MSGASGLQGWLTRLTSLRASRRSAAFNWTPEAERVRSALELHELGVQLYRQRMRREHPEANPAEIDGLVRAWLATPPPDIRLSLPSRERRGFAG